MAGEIDRYCEKNRIPPKIALRLHLAFEEFVHQILIPALEKPHINVVTEYSEAEERATMIVRHNDPAEGAAPVVDELSVTLLKGIVSRMEYSAADSEEYSHTLTMEFTL